MLKCSRIQGWVQVAVCCNEKVQEILQEKFKLSVKYILA